MKRICCLTLAALVLLGCGNFSRKKQAPAEKPDPVEEKLRGMSFREKLGQLFCVRPEAFDVTLSWEDDAQLASFQTQQVNARMRRVSAEYPAGGIILFAHNIKDPEQLNSFVDSLKSFSGEPLLYIDEEGGRVARIGNNPAFQVPKFRSMAAVAKSGKPADAFACGNAIGTYLKQYGFDVDLAPVADVNTNPANPVIGTRAFSSDPAEAAKMVVQYIKGLRAAGIASCVKHFPGHGDTQTDTHFGYAQSLKTWEQMSDCEMLPFKAAISANVPMIMTAHIATPKVTGTQTPATLSEEILQGKLRKELGYKNIIITDALAMGAITRHYKPGESAVKCLQAGADIILCPKDYIQAYDAVLNAVAVDSTLTESRIDESVRRVLALKLSLR